MSYSLIKSILCIADLSLTEGIDCSQQKLTVNARDSKNTSAWPLKLELAALIPLATVH